MSAIPSTRSRESYMVNLKYLKFPESRFLSPAALRIVRRSDAGITYLQRKKIIRLARCCTQFGPNISGKGTR